MHHHPWARKELYNYYIVQMIGQVGPELEDHVLLCHANKANTLGLLVDEVAQSHHERLLGEATYVHDCLVEVRCMSAVADREDSRSLGKHV
jgi:hypothetical protein